MDFQKKELVLNTLSSIRNYGKRRIVDDCYLGGYLIGIGEAFLAEDEIKTHMETEARTNLRRHEFIVENQEDQHYMGDVDKPTPFELGYSKGIIEILGSQDDLSDAESYLSGTNGAEEEEV